MRKRIYPLNRSGIVWLCALVLIIAAVLSVPLAASKYMAVGQGTAKARVAKWEPVWLSTYPASAEKFGGTFVNPGAITQNFSASLTNNSEVTIEGMYQPMMIGVKENTDPDRLTTYSLGEYTYKGVRTPAPENVAKITKTTVDIGATKTINCAFTGSPIATQLNCIGTGDFSDTPVLNTNYRWEAYRINFDAIAVQLD